MPWQHIFQGSSCSKLDSLPDEPEEVLEEQCSIPQTLDEQGVTLNERRIMINSRKAMMVVQRNILDQKRRDLRAERDRLVLKYLSWVRECSQLIGKPDWCALVSEVDNQIRWGRRILCCLKAQKSSLTRFESLQGDAKALLSEAQKLVQHREQLCQQLAELKRGGESRGTCENKLTGHNDIQGILQSSFNAIFEQMSERQMDAASMQNALVNNYNVLVKQVISLKLSSRKLLCAFPNLESFQQSQNAFESLGKELCDLERKQEEIAGHFRELIQRLEDLNQFNSDFMVLNKKRIELSESMSIYTEAVAELKEDLQRWRQDVQQERVVQAQGGCIRCTIV